MYIEKVAIDTNAYRALKEGNKKVAKAVRSAVVVGIPITVLGELYFGFENGSKKEQNLAELKKVTNTPSVKVLNIDRQTAKIFGEIATELMQKGKPIQQNDIWIASIAKQNDFSLITADKGFEHITGLQIIKFTP